MDYMNLFLLLFFFVMFFLLGFGIFIFCFLDKKLFFVGCELECDVVLNLLVLGDSWLVNIWGLLGFGKMLVVIEVVYYLCERNIFMYFIFVCGVKSKEEIVLKLLSIFVGINK